MAGTLIECDLCGRTELTEVVKFVVVAGVGFTVCETCNCKKDLQEQAEIMARLYLSAPTEGK